MEYKGYKIESIKNDGHLQRVAFGIYKNGKLISTAETSREAQHEIDDMINRPITVEYLLVNKKNDSKSRETLKTTEAKVDKEIINLERKYRDDKNYEIRDIRKVRDMKTTDKLDKAIKMMDEDKAYSVSYRVGNGPYQSIGVIASSENEAIKKFRAYKEKRGQKDIEVFGASIGESLETMERKGKPIIR